MLTFRVYFLEKYLSWGLCGDKVQKQKILKSLDSYPAMDFASAEFPKEEYIAFAVCGKECGNEEFIVDDETQVCACCGNPMFRT